MLTQPPRTNPSALQTLISTHAPPSQDPEARAYHALALLVSHNLRYQHNWTSIRIHDLTPRPLVSGLPPRRLYVHPDEQIALLQAQKDAGRPAGLDELVAEREWVLPAALREKWSLRRFGELFDGIGVVPEEGGEGRDVFEDEGPVDLDEQRDDVNDTKSEQPVNEWRTNQPKRLLMAIVDDDSTVVYYIVHDGIVKPRQN